MVVKPVGGLNCGGRGDVVEIDSWVAAEGKNGMRRDFLVRDYTTGEVIARATRCVIWDYEFLFSFETIISIIRDTLTSYNFLQRH